MVSKESEKYLNFHPWLYLGVSLYSNAGANNTISDKDVNLSFVWIHLIQTQWGQIPDIIW